MTNSPSRCVVVQGDQMASIEDGDYLEMEDVQAAVARHNSSRGANASSTLSFAPTAGTIPAAPGQYARETAKRTYIYEGDSD